MKSDILYSTASTTPDLARDGWPTLRPREIALMFSGGVDSTATAILLAEKFDKVHLLTYKNGYGHYNHWRTANRVKELNRKLGDRFVYSLIGTKPYFDDVLVRSVVDDFKEYKSGFIWCMGCKMAMHMRSALYCLEHGLFKMTDGSNSDTDEMVEQMLISLTLIRGFYGGFGINFGTPVYESTRDDSRTLIGRHDLKMGTKILDRHLNIQPSCVAGELYYVPYVLFNKKVKHDESTVARFIQAKQEIARRLMRTYFADRDVDLDALLAARSAQRDGLVAAAAAQGIAAPSPA